MVWENGANRCWHCGSTEHFTSECKKRQEMGDFDWPENDEFIPYDVKCARCGIVISCINAVPEEGDEWECFPCNDRCNEQERLAEHVRKLLQDKSK